MKSEKKKCRKVDNGKHRDKKSRQIVKEMCHIYSKITEFDFV